uniref:Uncharacterized protein n=1 Tax=Anopheles coluzzii TaxID=1518534 RepID=A0A8W7NZL1_ANOCL
MICFCRWLSLRRLNRIPTACSRKSCIDSDNDGSGDSSTEYAQRFLLAQTRLHLPGSGNGRWGRMTRARSVQLHLPDAECRIRASYLETIVSGEPAARPPGISSIVFGLPRSSSSLSQNVSVELSSSACASAGREETIGNILEERYFDRCLIGPPEQMIPYRLGLQCSLLFLFRFREDTRDVSKHVHTMQKLMIGWNEAQSKALDSHALKR